MEDVFWLVMLLAAWELYEYIEEKREALKKSQDADKLKDL